MDLFKNPALGRIISESYRQLWHEAADDAERYRVAAMIWQSELSDFAADLAARGDVAASEWARARIATCTASLLAVEQMDGVELPDVERAAPAVSGSWPGR